MHALSKARESRSSSVQSPSTTNLELFLKTVSKTYWYVREMAEP
jgi:hypothetical protein